MTKIFLAAALLATTASAETVRYTAIFGGKNVGHVIVDRQGDSVTVDYDVKNNGRGPTMKEALTLLPTGCRDMGDHRRDDVREQGLGEFYPRRG